MSKHIFHFTSTLLSLIILISSCSSSRCDERERLAVSYESIPHVQMVDLSFVEPSFLVFNTALHTGRLIEGAEQSFPLLQSGFWISRSPVTPAVYEAYMGEGTWPAAGVCHTDAEAFLDAVYTKTGIPVILPTEAMYEAALESGIIDASKSSPELLSDTFGPDKPYNSLVTDWRGRGENKTMKVVRKPYSRDAIESYRRRQVNTFRVALRSDKKAPQEMVNTVTTSYTGAPKEVIPSKETFEVNGVSFAMLPVEGGTMTLGATEEQERYAEEDEAPLREVTLPSFALSETEVTVGLWQAVMGGLPALNDKNYPNRAVVGVSWYDAQRFVLKLRRLTGRPFRLPSEDEWEYAARGGKKTHGYIFSGSNSVKDYVVCTVKEVRPALTDVASKKANELGFYDMSGNAWEWVRGVDEDENCILRGGSRMSRSAACRVSNRQRLGPENKKDTFGFRLAL